METQEQKQSGTNAKKTGNKNSGKEGILKSQSADETITDISENEELFTNTQVERTGTIRLVGNEKVGYWLAIANFRLNEPLATIEEAQEIAEKPTWETIVNLIGAIGLLEKGQKMAEETKANTIENKIQEKM